MRFPEILESAAYGNPEDYLDRKRAQEAAEKKRAEESPRRTLHVKPGFRKSRQEAEAWFADLTKRD